MAQDQIGRYQVLEEIGRGGMATVYRALDPRIQREVAIKVMTQDLLQEANLKARFEREAQTIATLEHPAIVPVYDFGEEDARPYLVMRLMSGGTLGDRLDKGSLPISDTVTILERIGSALERAHQKGIVHRDLKPSNIMFDEYGDAFLADFGIARLTESAVTLTGNSVIGTPAYMSPEQIHGDKSIDGRSDIYALGVICFEMLTGQRPYQDSTPTKVMMKHIMDPIPEIREVNPDLPNGVEVVISRTMAKEPEERYSSAGELTDSLSTFASLAQVDIVERKAPSTVPETEFDAQDAEPVPSTVVEESTPAKEEIISEETSISKPAFASQEPALSLSERAARPKKQTRISGKLIAAILFGGLALLIILSIGIGAVVLLSDSLNPFNEPAAAPSTSMAIVEDERTPTDTPDLPTSVDQGEDAELLMNQFLLLVADEAYDEALAVINQAIDLAPDNAEYYQQRSQLHSTLGAYSPALDDINRAIELDPEEMDHLVQRGINFREMGELDAALEDLNQAVFTVPENPYYRAELGLTYSEIGELTTAMDELNQAIEIDPNNNFSLGVRAEILLKMGDWPLALDDLNKAIEIDPNEVWYLDQLATIYAWLLGDFDQALGLFNQAIELEPNTGWRYNDRAIVNRELGNIDAALADHETAIQRNPDEVWNYLNRAITYRDYIGDFGAALDDYDLALEIDPAHPDVRGERGYFFQYALGDYDSALAEYDRALESNPADADLFVRRAVLLREIGDIDGALADHQQAIMLNPEDSRSYLERGITMLDLVGDPISALTDFDQAIEIFPENIDAYLARANILAWDFGDYEAAFLDLNRCKEIDPFYHWCYYDEGWIRDDYGDIEGAVTNFRHFLERVPEFECVECQEEASDYISINS
jgi:serine/threonine-protein kinase